MDTRRRGHNGRTASVRQLRVVALLCLGLIGALLLGTGATAQQAPDRAAIVRHLDAVFGRDDRPIRKWPDDVRYAVLGTPLAEHRDGVNRVMRAIAAATGLAVDDVSDAATAANIIVYFADTLDELLPDPWLGQMFQQPDETDEGFEMRIRRRFDEGGWMTGHSYDGDAEDVSLSLVNINVGNGDPRVLAMRMGLAAFFAFNASDEIRPSLMNTGDVASPGASPGANPELSDIDRAFLAALYDDSIDMGEEYADVKDKLVDLIRRKLRGI
jgi:hypothetical protein